MYEIHTETMSVHEHYLFGSGRKARRKSQHKFQDAVTPCRKFIHVIVNKLRQGLY
jgi:hypothetical protein